MQYGGGTRRGRSWGAATPKSVGTKVHVPQHQAPHLGFRGRKGEGAQPALQRDELLRCKSQGGGEIRVTSRAGQASGIKDASVNTLFGYW